MLNQFELYQKALTLTLSGITKTVTAGDQYHLSWRSGDAQLGDQMYQVEINYTEPSI